MSREEEFVGSLTHSSSFPSYFLLFVIIKVCRVLFVKFVKTLINLRKLKMGLSFPDKNSLGLSLLISSLI